MKKGNVRFGGADVVSRLGDKAGGRMALEPLPEDVVKAGFLDPPKAGAVTTSKVLDRAQNKKLMNVSRLKFAAQAAADGKVDALDRAAYLAKMKSAAQKSMVPSQAEQDFLKIVRKGGVPAIVKTMRAEMEFAWVAELGSRSLINLLKVHNDINGDKDLGQPTSPSEMIFEAGGLQLFVQLLIIFKNNDVVIEAVLALLSTLVRYDDENAERIAVLGGGTDRPQPYESTQDQQIGATGML